MDRKKKIRVAVIIPVIVTLLVLGGVVTLVLIAGSNGAATATPSMDMAAAEGAAVPGSPAPSPDQPYETAGPSCAFDFLLGLPSSVAAEQIASLGRPVRIVLPDGMVTQDYSPDRINLQLDSGDIVRSVTCG